jgi:hypothetical protein
MSNVTITAESAKLLRSVAKNTTFSTEYSLAGEWTRDNGYTLRVWEKVRQPEGFTPDYTERRVDIPVEGRTERYRSEPEIDRYICSRSMYVSNRYDGVRAILGNVREGDTLSLQFVIGNDTDNLRNAGLSHDTCSLAHVRNGKVLAVALFDDRVAPDGPYTALFCDKRYRAATVPG